MQTGKTRQARTAVKKTDPNTGRGASVADPAGGPDYNLLGQRLGRKGRDTRERILAATVRLCQQGSEEPISLSAVAREASLAMTTLYLYFSDLSELLVAAVEPIMADADAAYVAFMRERWPDERLEESCVEFVAKYFRFWAANISMVHLRQSVADRQDARMIRYRIDVSRKMIELLVVQMDGNFADQESDAHGMATVLWTGLERMLTITRDISRAEMQKSGVSMNISNVLKAEARLLALGIRYCRQIAANPVAG